MRCFTSVTSNDTIGKSPESAHNDDQGTTLSFINLRVEFKKKTTKDSYKS